MIFSRRATTQDSLFHVSDVVIFLFFLLCLPVSAIYMHIPSPSVDLDQISTLGFSLFFTYGYQQVRLFLNLMETVELKVEMVGIHEKRLRKCLSKLKGMEKVEVDAKSEKVTVTVTGCTHRNKILKAVRRSGLRADFWSPQNELLLLNACASAAGSPFPFNNFTFF